MKSPASAPPTVLTVALLLLLHPPTVRSLLPLSPSSARGRPYAPLFRTTRGVEHPPPPTSSSSCLPLLRASRFERDLEETRRRMGLPEDLLSGKSLVETERDREEAAQEAEREALRAKSGPYRSVEEWNEDEETNAAIKNSVAWEMAVQRDGQRFGNKIVQDAILRKNL